MKKELQGLEEDIEVDIHQEVTFIITYNIITYDIIKSTELENAKPR